MVVVIPWGMAIDSAATDFSETERGEVVVIAQRLKSAGLFRGREEDAGVSVRQLHPDVIHFEDLHRRVGKNVILPPFTGLTAHI